MLPLGPYPHGQCPTDSGPRCNVPLTASEYKEDFGNRNTGFYSFVSASGSLFLSILGREGSPTTKEKHRSPELGVSLAHSAWVDLGTQATENVLTAAVGADNEGPV